MYAMTPQRVYPNHISRARSCASDTDQPPLTTPKVRQPRLHRALTALMVGLMLLLTSGCGAGSLISNPFASDPTPTPAPPTPPAASSAAQAAPSPAATEAAPAFTPIWVKNHRIAEMWSGPTAGSDVVNFGMTSHRSAWPGPQPVDDFRASETLFTLGGQYTISW